MRDIDPQVMPDTEFNQGIRLGEVSRGTFDPIKEARAASLRRVIFDRLARENNMPRHNQNKNEGLSKVEAPNRLKGFMAVKGVIDPAFFQLAERAFLVSAAGWKKPLEQSEHNNLAALLADELDIKGPEYREQYGLDGYEAQRLDEFLGVTFTKAHDGWVTKRVTPKTLQKIRDDAADGGEQSPLEAERSLLRAVGTVFKKVEYREPRVRTLDRVAMELSKHLSKEGSSISFQALFGNSGSIHETLTSQLALRKAWNEFLSVTSNTAMLKGFHKYNPHSIKVMCMLSGVQVSGDMTTKKDARPVQFKDIRADLLRNRVSFDDIDSVIAASFTPLLAYLEQKANGLST